MQKKKVHAKYCLLGYGYTSFIAYHKLLQKNHHDEILIVQDERANPIFTLEHQDFDFSPLPIFPVEESELYNSDLFKGIPKQKPIRVQFSELLNFDYAAFNTKEGSLAAFMVKEQGIDKNLCLGAKQWGEKMFVDAFSQVQSKIKRHYISPKGNTRIGYIEGKSLFKYAIDALNPNIFKHAGVLRIDINTNEVHTKTHIIRFEKLISTIPLHYLLKTCNLPFEHETTYAGAYFCFFKYDKGFEANQVVYDCDFNSDVIRIFSIKDNFLLVQLNGDKHGTIPISKIKARVQELAPDIVSLEFARELYVPMCYPLELVTDSNTIDSIEKLKENDVVTLGRFGNWEYSDLHELDWSSID